MGSFSKILAFVSGTVFITGTCVGAGMLGIPLVTQEAGFYPALVINLFCWLLMLATGLLFLEVTLWMPDRSNLLSMASHFLGKKGKILGGATFLFLYYCLMVAYFAAGVPLFQRMVGLFGLSLSWGQGIFFFCLLFGGIVVLGPKVIDRLNSLLVLGLFLSYGVIVWGTSSVVDPLLLQRKEWSLLLIASPVLLSAYGYHNLIPSLSTYLKRHRQILQGSIVLGTFLAFVIYSLWQWLLLGSISPEKLQDAMQKGESITMVVEREMPSHWMSEGVAYFSFFALTTSLLGVSFSMGDFLADGWRLLRTKRNWMILCLLVFVPPAFIAAFNPHLFLKALGYAGGFGEALLNGLLPISMVWVGRYRRGLPMDGSLLGGKGMLLLLTLGILLVLGVEVRSFW